MSVYRVWSSKKYLGSLLARDGDHALKQARANWPKFTRFTIKLHKGK